jgi:hypothetical protein
MDDEAAARRLKSIIADLKPLKQVRLKVAINAIASTEIVAFDADADRSLREKFERAARLVLDDIKANPMVKGRPNEAGNAIEGRVKTALIKCGLAVETPKSKSGKAKSAGYPDLLVTDEIGGKTYVECKTLNLNSLNSTLRSFYLSPSDESKASETARHFLFAFVMEKVKNLAGEEAFAAVSAKLLSLEDMICDIKLEFQSHNKRMYSGCNSIFEIMADPE